MKSYMHPASFRPPLAFGGHEFVTNDRMTTCWTCGGSLPTWAVHEGLWMAFLARWCPNKVAALPAPRRRHANPWRKPELPGQLSIYDVLGEP